MTIGHASSLISCGVRCRYCFTVLQVGEVNVMTRSCEPAVRTGLVCTQCLSIDAIASVAHGSAWTRERIESEMEYK